MTISLPDGTSQDVKLTLEQTDCELTGLIEGNNQTPIEDGKAEGSTFSFAMNVNNGDGQIMAIAWEGTMDGDSISGTWGSQIIGSLDFTGTRAEG
ncbi:MAG: hypothetical protein OEU54_12940 [Gemmatimonadota bacterium]|nr:hypothetical protein [Gemmatimonadota bacterium]